MATETKKDKAYYETLKRLNQYIDENYDEEGFLPSENKMSGMLGVSRGTYRSALAAVIANNFVVSYPKRGHKVVPKRFRIKKVGIVIGSGKESPFLPCSGIFTSLVDQLQRYKIESQLIQSSVPENIKWRALAHAANVLIWVIPDSNLLPVIFAGANDTPFPQLIVSNKDLSAIKQNNQVNYVITSPNEAGTRIAKFFIEKGHKDVVYIGCPGENFDSFKDEFHKNEIPYNDSLLVDYSGNWEEQLNSIIDNQHFTALTLGGGNQTKEKVYQILNRLPTAKQPEILVSDSTVYQYFKKAFPKLRFLSYSQQHFDKLGAAAGKQVANYILKNKDMESQEIDIHSIR